MKADQELNKSIEKLKNLSPLYLLFLFLPVTLTAIIMGVIKKSNISFDSRVVYALCNWAVLLILYIMLNKGQLVKGVFRFSKIKYKELMLAIVAWLVGIFIVYPVTNYLTSLMGIPMKGMGFTISNGFVLAIIIFYGVITAPFVEEVLFRGLGVGYLLAKGFSPVISGMITIILFSLIHIPYFGFGGAVFIFFWSILPTCLRIKYDSLTPGWLMHLLNNFFAYIIVTMYL
jgi:membrane protease YdiL (CAAX protease family)